MNNMKAKQTDSKPDTAGYKNWDLDNLPTDLTTPVTFQRLIKERGFCYGTLRAWKRSGRLRTVKNNSTLTTYQWLRWAVENREGVS